MIAIILAYGVSIIAIGTRRAELFDPRMLIRRHALRSKLATDPIGFLRQHHAHPVAQSRERRRASSHPGPNNRDVGMKLIRCSRADERSRERSKETSPIQHQELYWHLLYRAATTGSDLFLSHVPPCEKFTAGRSYARIPIPPSPRSPNSEDSTYPSCPYLCATDRNRNR